MLLTGARLAGPVELYAEAHVAGPHVRHFGRALFVTSPRALVAQAARAVLRCLPRSLAARLRAARNQGDAMLGAFAVPRDIRWCAQAVVRLAPEAVLVDTIFRSPLLAEPELQGINSVIIAHDLFHRRAMAFEAAGYTVRPAGLTRAHEAALLSRARAVGASQPDEAEAIRAMCPQLTVFTVLKPATLRPPPPAVRRIPGRLVFIGSAALPNLDGMRWFLAEIWPQLAGHGITLDIIGACGTTLRRLPPGVRAYGVVAELAPLLHQAALAIAPLRTGSGIKVKLLDYARHGLTTVVTPPALAGFQAAAEAPFIVAGSAVMFAEAVRRNAHNPAPPDRAMAYCVKYYGEAASFGGLEAALRAPGTVPAALYSGAV